MMTWIHLVGWALVHALWQITLLAGASALAGLFLRDQARHRMNALCLLLCLVLPGATAWRMHRPMQAAVAASSGLNEPEDRESVSRTADQPLAVPLLIRLKASVQPHLPWAVAVWALGVLAMALRLGGGYALCLRWKRQGQPAPAEWQERLDALAKRMGIMGPVRLLLSWRGDTPLTLGWWKPVVMLPAALLTQLPPAYLEALLAHELAHVRRLDYLSNLLQGLAETLLFFHPAVWWLSARIRAEREHLADDLAAQCLGEPRRLALALNALDDLQPSFPQPHVLALAARGGSLLTRIQRLMAPPKPVAGPTWALLSLLLIPCAALALRASEPERPPIPAEPELVAQLDALAAKEGLDPQLLRSMAWVESGFNRGARSPRGAMGVLQVMPETAQRFGAQDLKDRDQVMAAGAKYLRHLLDRYQGDLKKAVTAFNSGEQALDAGKLTEESVRYQAMVLELLKLKAVQPAAPLQEGEVAGVFRRQGKGNQWMISSRVSCMGGFKLEFLPAPDGEGKVGKAYGTILMGSKPGSPATWIESTPRVVIEIPPGASLVVRATDEASGRSGEYPLTLSGDWNTFRFRMARSKL